ncbi:MAG: hypothetical protein Q7R64_02325 [bacterium]|nr:hypothetical protein [bacterium]
MREEINNNHLRHKTLRQRIMRRIYLLFMVRNLSPFAFDCVLIVATAFLVTVFVSVRDVLSNFSTAASGSNMLQFSVSAVSGTKLQTKLLLVVLGVVGFFAVRHLKQAVRAVRTLRESSKPEARSSKNPQV